MARHELTAADAHAHGIRLAVVHRSDATRGVVPLPRRRVVARGFAWMARIRGPARDDARLPETVHGLALARFMPKRCAERVEARFIPGMVERTYQAPGEQLAALGRREAALTATEEAVTLWKALAAAQPDAFGSELVRKP
ncbi:hypothetical protein [Roseiflexus castenholzii]|uniref:hypothetical protein n=1 Tax=Roseiflexus castenholzii TaxID=120962 RepID=UPI003C7BC83A